MGKGSFVQKIAPYELGSAKAQKCTFHGPFMTG